MTFYTGARVYILDTSIEHLVQPEMSNSNCDSRFRIGEYNAEDLILSALPYHGSRTFVLILRAVPELKDPQSPWHWLLPVADTGTPMDTLALHSILASNLALLRRVCNFALSAHKVCMCVC
jgi:U3 small nucleolar RNA-associated protein 10